MSRFLTAIAATLLLGGAPMALAAPPSASEGYHARPSIPLPDGGWDLLSVDSARHSVLVARSGAVSVADMASGMAHDVGQIQRGHAVLAVPGTAILAVTSGQDNTLRLLDAGDGHQLASVPVGKNPDAELWDPVSRRVVVMNAAGGTVSVVDPVARRVTQTIAVKPALELGAMVGPHLLAINDEDLNELELVDLSKGTALPAITLTGCEGPTGLAYDPGSQLTVSACANGVAAVVDVTHRKLVGLMPIGAGPDTVLFDARRHRFLVPCGRSGTLSVISVGPGKHLAGAGTVPTEMGARTGAIDPATGRIYLPAARYLPAEPGKRPSPVPGSVHLIVLDPA
ncbi:MAG: gluconolactonase [Croceibacterium sp.]